MVSLSPPVHLMIVRAGSSPIMETPIFPFRSSVEDILYVRACIKVRGGIAQSIDGLLQGLCVIVLPIAPGAELLFHIGPAWKRTIEFLPVLGHHF
jgi:hypothetical protein